MRKVNWRRYRFLFALLVLIGGGAALILFGSKLIGHSAEGIGEALMVAGLLGLTVDGYVKEHLLKEASRDVAKYLIGYQLPTEIQDTIKELMSTKRISRDMHLHYELTPIRDVPDKILVEITLTYYVENISNTSHPYEQYFYQHSSFSPCFLELRCDSNDKDGNYFLGAEDLNRQMEGPGRENAHPSYRPEDQITTAR